MFLIGYHLTTQSLCFSVPLKTVLAMQDGTLLVEVQQVFEGHICLCSWLISSASLILSCKQGTGLYSYFQWEIHSCLHPFLTMTGWYHRNENIPASFLPYHDGLQWEGWGHVYLWLPHHDELNWFFKWGKINLLSTILISCFVISKRMSCSIGPSITCYLSVR